MRGEPIKYVIMTGMSDNNKQLVDFIKASAGVQINFILMEKTGAKSHIVLFF
jgi:hypothetical protein